jgi:WD40 repeat protein
MFGPQEPLAFGWEELARMVRALLGICLLLAFAAPARAEGVLGLNQVWSRLADINGELGSVESAELSPDSRFVVTGTKFDYSVRMFRTVDGAQIWERTLPQEIERVAWTRDGRFVVSVSEDAVMRVMRAEDGEVVHVFAHENGIDGLSVSPDGHLLATGQERIRGVGVIRVFNTRDWSVARQIDHPGTVNGVHFSADSGMLAAIGDFDARVYRVADWSVAQQWSLPRSNPLFEDGDAHIYISTRFNPDGTILAVGASHGFVYLYDVASGALLRRFNKTGQKTEIVEWTGDGRHLLVAGHGATIDFFATSQLLDPTIRNDSLPFALRAPVSDSMEYLDFNDQGTLLVSAHQDGTVQLWTFMSDNPRINEERHRMVRRAQDEAAREAGRSVE